MQTAVEWLLDRIEDVDNTPEICEQIKVQAKKMERVQHGKTWDTALDKYEVRAGNYMRAYEDFDDYFAETYGSKGSDECQFEPTTNTSSATICKHCGKEKFLHQ